MINMMLSDAATVLHKSLCGEDIRFTGCNTDSRSIHAGEMFIALRGDRFDGHDFIHQARQNGASAVMVEMEFGQQSWPLLQVSNTRKAMGELAGYWRSCFDIPLIAVTGSNGKTTVKEMLISILAQQAPVLSTQGNLNNDIGVPLTLFGLADQHRFAVVEMGANHAGEIEVLSQMARPTVALITQCAAAHLEGFGSIAGVAHAKAEIFAGLTDNGIAIVNADDEYVDLWKSKAVTRKQLSFGLCHDADVRAVNVQFEKDAGQSSFTLHCSAGEIEISLPLPGIHNVMNALAASACSLAVEAPLDSIKAGLEKMHAIRGRLQVKKGIKGVRIYDDTYNANPASLNEALKVLANNSGRRWLVFGDMGELGGSAEALHLQAGEAARESGVERLYALGQLSKHTVKGFGAGAEHFSSVDELLKSLQEDLAKDVTLLVKGSRAMAMERVVCALQEEG